MEQGYQIIPPRYDYTYFELFLRYITTIEPEIFTETVIRYKDPEKEDLKISHAYKWAGSLLDKFNAASILRNEVLHQILMWKNEIEQVKERGFGSGIQRIILLVKYETFLNSIYSLCENISFLVKELYPKASLPRGFNDQKTKHLDRIKTLDSYYAEILATTDWYDEIHSMRTEATHYLSGFIFISDSGVPGYFNDKPYSMRGNTEIIDEEDIEKHVVETYNKVYSFVMQISKHFMELRCNKNKPIGELCLIGSRSGVRTMTLNDYLHQNPPRCEALEFNCPVEEKCTALNKPSERKIT
ncbi:hypothetical protein RSJ42_08140 [Methanosarcina hadiensis]|uniref:hypothetical protein n=1 Tax=Methanosarcina hadiensis TaxID=3078083 RepID=UPI00397799AF